MKPKYVLAVDPGIRQGGLASFRDGELLGAKSIVSSEKFRRGHVAWKAFADTARQVWLTTVPKGVSYPNLVAIEQMVHRKVAQNRGRSVDPDDLLQITGASAWLAGRLAESGADAVFYTPESYKGQLPKSVAKSRSQGTLTPAELKRIEKTNADLTEDIWDAVYFGLYVVGRVG